MRYFLEFARKNVHFGIILMSLFVFTQCGGTDTADADDGDDDVEDTDLTESQEEEVAGVSQTLVNNISDVGESLSGSGDGSLSALTKFTSDTINCSDIGELFGGSGSGTITVDTDSITYTGSITYNACEYTTRAGASFSFDGTMTFSQSMAGSVITYDLVYDSLTMSTDPDVDTAGDEVSFTADGELSGSLDTSDEIAVTFTDYTVTINEEDAYTVSGTLSIDSSGILTGTMTFTINTASVTCDFSSSLDLATATCENYVDACGLPSVSCPVVP